jgi:large subunit ribosomal protein L24
MSLIRKNDQVIVSTGKEKGKKGKIVHIMKERGRAVVEKLNMTKRHQKPTAKMRQGGIVEKESSIHLSNLMLYCSKCGKGSRAAVSADKSGKKVRSCVRCKESFT